MLRAGLEPSVPRGGSVTTLRTVKRERLRRDLTAGSVGGGVSFDPAASVSSAVSTSCYAQQLVRFREGNEFDAFRAATGLADFFDPGANTLALGGEKHDLVVVADAECAGDFDRAIFREIDGDTPVPPRRVRR